MTARGARLMHPGDATGDEGILIRPETPAEMAARHAWADDPPRWWVVTRSFGAGWFDVGGLVPSTVRPKGKARRARRFLRRAAKAAQGLPRAQTRLRWWHRLSAMRRERRDERTGRRKGWRGVRAMGVKILGAYLAMRPRAVAP